MFESLSTPESRSPAPPSTSEHLLATAERLFADQGIAAVSLRQIAIAAGQRNPAVVQYHFGSKEQLVRAIIEFRVAAINERRLELLAGRPKRGKAELRRILRAIIIPLHEPEAGTHYVRFLASLSAMPGALVDAFDEIDANTGLSGRLVADAMQDALSDQPDAIRDTRCSMVLRLILGTLAMRNEGAAMGIDDGLTDQVFIDNLIEAAVGLLAAPVPSGAIVTP